MTVVGQIVNMLLCNNAQRTSPAFSGYPEVPVSSLRLSIAAANNVMTTTGYYCDALALIPIDRAAFSYQPNDLKFVRRPVRNRFF
jgi:hypothetical protein